MIILHAYIICGKSIISLICYLFKTGLCIYKLCLILVYFVKIKPCGLWSFWVLTLYNRFCVHNANVIYFLCWECHFVKSWLSMHDLTDCMIVVLFGNYVKFVCHEMSQRKYEWYSLDLLYLIQHTHKKGVRKIYIAWHSHCGERSEFFTMYLLWSAIIYCSPNNEKWISVQGMLNDANH